MKQLYSRHTKVLKKEGNLQRKPGTSICMLTYVHMYNIYIYILRRSKEPAISIPLPRYYHSTVSSLSRHVLGPRDKKTKVKVSLI